MSITKQRVLAGFVCSALLALLFLGIFFVWDAFRVRNTSLVSITQIQKVLEMNNLPLAILYCRKRIQLKPNDTISYLLLGQCYEKKGDLRRAITLYKETAEKNTEEPLPYFYLGRAYYKNGEVENAVLYLKTFKGLASRNLVGEARDESLAQGRALLAALYMEYTKEYQKAASELRLICEADPSNWEARYQLGTAYAYSGQSQSAYREFQWIVDKNPGTEMARYAENAIQYVREKRSPDRSPYVLAG